MNVAASRVPTLPPTLVNHPALNEIHSVSIELSPNQMMFYLGLANYAGNLRRIGFTDADITQPGNDRIVDATHVAVQPLTADGDPLATVRCAGNNAPVPRACPVARLPIVVGTAKPKMNADGCRAPR
jgi:hypothetical protein